MPSLSSKDDGGPTRARPVNRARVESVWHVDITMPDYGPPSYTGDRPLGTCVVHGDYWTDDCLRCRGER